MMNQKKTSKLLGQYRQGNAIVKLYDDGTKVKETNDDEFSEATRPETMDVCISEFCENACAFCYANCTPNGKFADFSKYKRFLDSLPYLTEIAININSTPNPDLPDFLKKLKDKDVIVNATVNQKYFMENYNILRGMSAVGYIHGLGISLTNPEEEGFIERVQKFPNAIIHVINGLITSNEIKVLSDKGLKLLILGYKQVGRGIDWYSKEAQIIKRRQEWLDRNLPIVSRHFEVVSFDNLAVEQLDVKRLVTEEEYDERFLGADGTISFYVNLVQGYFAKNSLSDVHYEIGNKTVDECFKIILSNN